MKAIFIHLIVISVLAVNSLSRVCRWASPKQPLRSVRPSTSTQTTPLTPANTQHPHPLAKYTPEILVVSSGPLPLTKGRSSIGCAQAPHRLASRWYPFSIHSSKRCEVSSRMQLTGDLVPFLGPLEGRGEEEKKQERNSEVQREFPLQ